MKEQHIVKPTPDIGEKTFFSMNEVFTFQEAYEILTAPIDYEKEH